MRAHPAEPKAHTEGSLADRLNLKGSYPVEGRTENYVAENVPAGFGIMFMAGTLSGLLGIGSGAVKVLAMDQVMKLSGRGKITATAARSTGCGHWWR